MINFKLKYIHFRRRMPTCYLLSSKFMLTALSLLLIYLLTMNVILLSKVKSRGPAKLYYAATTNTTTSPNNDYAESGPKQADDHPSGSIFAPLPVKKIMMADTTHFIRSPIAEFIEHGLGFSRLFPFISANTISLAHCFLSVVSIKFLIDDALFWRQFGVCLFQLRNFLDSFDGVVYRAHAKKSTYKSHYGSLGYYVDAFSDVFGGLCLIGSITIYLLKHRPLKKKLTRCFRLADDVEELLAEASSSSSSSSSSSLSSSPTLAQMQASSTSESSSKCAQLKLLPASDAANYANLCGTTPSFFGYNRQAKAMLKDNVNHTIYATNTTILASIALLGIRYGLSAAFWDRSVHRYEDLLDSAPKSLLHQELQVHVLHSSITLFVMFLWRLMCALSLQDLILTAIFIDKIWVSFCSYSVSMLRRGKLN
jgi:hypothetical protein